MKHLLHVREQNWKASPRFAESNPPAKQNFVFVKTSNLEATKQKFPKGSRILPLGNYLADDFSVSDTIVLDALNHARSQSSLRNEVRTKFDKMELKFFDRYLFFFNTK